MVHATNTLKCTHRSIYRFSIGDFEQVLQDWPDIAIHWNQDGGDSVLGTEKVTKMISRPLLC
jgi:hypothetical protein